MKLNPNFSSTYEPKSLNDIVFTQRLDRNKLRDVVSSRNPFPGSGKNGILLVGDTGSGKSTLARLLPNLIEVARGGVEAVPTYHQISSSNNGVAHLFQIKQQVQLYPFQQQFHYIVLDEVDLLTPKAMDELKSAMNIAFGYSIWIMTTNDLSKVDTAVVNRCHTYLLDHAPSSEWLPLFRGILNDHGITDISEAEMLEQIDMCNGSGRDVIEAAKRIILDREEAVASPEYSLTANVV